MQSTVDYSSNLSDMTEFFIGSFDFDKLLKLKKNFCHSCLVEPLCCGVRCNTMEKNDRLKHSRIKAGFKTAASAATYLGIPYGTYSGHENGSRGIRDDELQHYAKTFKVQLYWLAFGEQATRAKLKLIGHAGAKDSLAKGRAKTVEIDASFPVPQETKAILVTSDEFEPMASKSDIVIIDEPLTAHELINCRVAMMTDGRILLGKLLSVDAKLQCNLQTAGGKVHLNKKPLWVTKIRGIAFAAHGPSK